MKDKPHLPLPVVASLVLAALLAAALLFAALVPIDAAHAATDASPSATADEPRAFGYFVGDIVTRRIAVQAPAPLQLDTDSLPRAGRQGQVLELRGVDWQTGRGGHHTLLLHYQVFLAPREVRTLEVPPVLLKFNGGPRVQEVRVDAWPVTVAPLAPLDASPRTGLGELRPDAPPPRIASAALQWRLGLWAMLAALLLAYLAHVYLALPWWSRRGRPFALAWQQLRRLPPQPAPADLRAAMQALHQALNRSAGQVLFEQGIADFLARQPRFAPLAGDLQRFFVQSRLSFFGSDDSAAPDRAWLLALCRRCRDIERGAA